VSDVEIYKVDNGTVICFYLQTMFIWL